MAGTLFGLGMSQQHDINGVPMSGCLLYLYEANTSTPVVAYQGPGLVAGTELPHPIIADSSGRIPAFWLADGAYRARLTDENGVVIFDEANILAIGAGGDVTTPSTPADSLFATGDTLWRPVNTTKTGWIRLNGRTIGSATSGASERANADVQSLFEYLWTNFSNTLCPVSTGRGASANADWLANKTITTISMRGRTALGVDDMGNSAAGIFNSVSFGVGNSTTGGSSGGAAIASLATNQIPAHTITVTDPGHTHTDNDTVGLLGAGGLAFTGGGQGSAAVVVNSATTGITAAYVNASQQPVQTVAPFVLGTWYMKL